MKITHTRHLTEEEIRPHWNDIIACFQKYCDRFSDEETVENMIMECFNGRRDLWIVQDDTGKVVLTPITEITTVNATGKKVLNFMEIGGENLFEALPLITEIEKWAKETHNIDECHFWGRTAYRKLLGQFGYKEAIVQFKKPIH